MKSKATLATTVLMVALTVPSIQAPLFSENISGGRHKHHHYKMIDVGTFGGPNTFIYSGPPSFLNFNGQGVPTGTAETTIPDPNPICIDGDCLIVHAFKYESGKLRDLGALPGVNNSIGTAINASGEVVGISENGSIDPLTGFPETRAVVWNRTGIADLGTFGGNVSDAAAVNSHGDIAGVAANSIPDPYAGGLGPCIHLNCFPVATQQRAFLWRHGVMRDLGTLGGNDAGAGLINDQGQVAGVSYTNTTPNGTTGLPTQDPFFWDNGRMFDIGSLGGTYGYPWSMNERGQVVGQSNLAGDTFQRAFLWDRGALHDLGTLGGSYSAAFWINQGGEAVGYGALPGDFINGYPNYRGVLWKNWRNIDLGALPGLPRSAGVSINSSEQIVGNSASQDFSIVHAMLWENGGPMVDLNDLVSNESGATLTTGYVINEQGGILAVGYASGGESRMFVLIPDGDCDEACEARIGTAPRVPGPTQPSAGMFVLHSVLEPEIGQTARPK